MSGNIKLSSIHSSYIFIQEWNTRQQQLLRPVGPVMEEVKQEQGPGEGGAGLAAIVKPTNSFKIAPGKAAAAKSTNDVKKARMSKKKGNDGVFWFIQELRDNISLLLLLYNPF